MDSNRNPHNAQEIVEELIRATEASINGLCWEARNELVFSAHYREREYRITVRCASRMLSEGILLGCICPPNGRQTIISSPDLHMSEMPVIKFLRSCFLFVGVSVPLKWNGPQTERDCAGEKLRKSMERLYKLARQSA